MSFETHFQKTNRLREKARALVIEGVPAPTAAELMTPAGRARWFKRVRDHAAKVLTAALSQAEKQGKAHGREVVKDWEGEA